VVVSLTRIFGKRWKGKDHEPGKIRLLEEDQPEGTGLDLWVIPFLLRSEMSFKSAIFTFLAGPSLSFFSS
jgi:hypothetical protein